MFKLLLAILLLFASICEAQSLQGSRLSSPPLTHIAEFSRLKFLGEGDQARVYKTKMGQPLAVKVFYTKSEMLELHPEKKEFIESFFEPDGSSRAALSEIEVGKSFDHPNIMKLYSAGSTHSKTGERVDFVVLEFVDGKSLGKASFSQEKKVKIAIQLLQALQHVFSKGYIHMDLWSENVYIDHEGNLKLIDLGSFDPLPKSNRKKYHSYFKVIYQVLDEILDDQKLLDELKAVAKRGQNCTLTYKNKKLLVLHLRELEKQLLYKPNSEESV